MFSEKSDKFVLFVKYKKASKMQKICNRYFSFGKNYAFGKSIFTSFRKNHAFCEKNFAKS